MAAELSLIALNAIKLMSVIFWKIVKIKFGISSTKFLFQLFKNMNFGIFQKFELCEMELS